MKEQKEIHKSEQTEKEREERGGVIGFPSPVNHIGLSEDEREREKKLVGVLSQVTYKGLYRLRERERELVS